MKHERSKPLYVTCMGILYKVKARHATNFLAALRDGTPTDEALDKWAVELGRVSNITDWTREDAARALGVNVPDGFKFPEKLRK